MRLYDDLIVSTLDCLDASSCKQLPVGEAAKEKASWPDAGKAMMILRSDMAYELGGNNLPAVGNTMITTDDSLVEKDEILLLGPDLSEIAEDRPYGRIAIVKVDESAIGSGDKLYNTIQNIGYFRYHIFPEGFMLRVSSSNDRESVRISKEALSKGLDFTAIGNSMISAIKLHKQVISVKIIFITESSFDYGKLADNQKKTKQITATIDHMLKDVNMDCQSCGLQEICDEVEELKEMHFGIKENR